MSSGTAARRAARGRYRNQEAHAPSEVIARLRAGMADVGAARDACI
jgi:hypothetical protein